MMRALRNYVWLAAILLSVCLSLPAAAQDDLALLVEGLFPGEVWFEVTGYLSNEGIGSERATGNGRNGESAPRSPIWSMDMYQHQWDPFPGFRFVVNPTVHDPQYPESLVWLKVVFDAVNLEGQPPQVYPVIAHEEADYSGNTPQVALYDVIDERWGEYYELIEGKAFFEVEPDGDITAARFAIELTLQSTAREGVEPLRIRAAGYTYSLFEQVYTDLGPGESVLSLQGEIAANHIEQIAIRVEPITGSNEQEQITVHFDSTGLARDNSDVPVPIQFEITGEASLPLCDPNDWLVRDGFANRSGQFLVDERVFTPEMNKSNESFGTGVTLCYEDRDRTLVSGVVSISSWSSEWADWYRYVDLFLLFRGMPVERLT